MKFLNHGLQMIKKSVQTKTGHVNIDTKETSKLPIPQQSWIQLFLTGEQGRLHIA